MKNCGVILKHRRNAGSTSGVLRVLARYWEYWRGPGGTDRMLDAVLTSVVKFMLAIHLLVAAAGRGRGGGEGGGMIAVVV